MVGKKIANVFVLHLTTDVKCDTIVIEREVQSMWKKVLELENKINAERIELAKVYAINNGMNPKYMTETDLLAIYSCLIVKAQKRMNENLDKLMDSMV